MSKICDIYSRLCMASVFKAVLDKPLFTCFAKYAEENENKNAKIKAYAAFVSEIYKEGASLTALTFRLISEDENVYIKARAHSLAISAKVRSAVKAELSVFSEFNISIYNFINLFLIAFF